MRRVVVTGLGMVSPMACGVEATWRRLLASELGAARVENFDVSDLPCQIAAQVPRGGAPDAFNPDDWMEPQGTAPRRRLHHIRNERRDAGATRRELGA